MNKTDKYVLVTTVLAGASALFYLRAKPTGALKSGLFGLNNDQSQKFVLSVTVLGTLVLMVNTLKEKKAA